MLTSLAVFCLLVLGVAHALLWWKVSGIKRCRGCDCLRCNDLVHENEVADGVPSGSASEDTAPNRTAPRATATPGRSVPK
jgi:hypothetical protein